MSEDNGVWTAGYLADGVKTGRFSPREVTAIALARINSNPVARSAFRHVRADEALDEATRLSDRTDLGSLPLAGVPVAIKETSAVRGQTVAWDTSCVPQRHVSDSDVTARLRAAGAIIIGTTRAPQCCLWSMTDDDSVIANPWATGYSAGGSSGGSAAAIAAGMVPIAHGTDALGSVRSPAAICGIVGLAPGFGTVLAADSTQWSGLCYTHGPMATTVADAALMLSVLAQRPELGVIADTEDLRIATSTRPPGLPARIPREYIGAITNVANVLRLAGHRVAKADPPYGNITPALLARWLGGPGPDGPVPTRLEKRTQRHLRAARVVHSARLIRQAPQRQWIARAESFFAEYDVLVTPVLATLPPIAQQWSQRGWWPNALAATRLAPFTLPWNLAGFPAMSVPAGRMACGVPIGVQLVAPPGGESLLLAVAAQIEKLTPWPRVKTDAALPISVLSELHGWAGSQGV